MLTSASICLAILFFLINKTQTDIAKEKAIESAHEYNCINASNIMTSLGNNKNRTIRYHEVPFAPDIYKQNIDYIFLKSNKDDAIKMLHVIMEMEQSNNIMEIERNLMSQGFVKDQKEINFETYNTKLINLSNDIDKHICEGKGKIKLESS
jgi:hypothetical protein